jgi:hypothetical protein
MLIRGEALINTVTLAFTISGERGDWKVSMTAPGATATEDETAEATWYLLLNEMLLAAYETVRPQTIPSEGGGRIHPRKKARTASKDHRQKDRTFNSRQCTIH